MKKEQGMTLLLTLVFSGLISYLVIANLQSQQMAIKVLTVLQAQRQASFELKTQFKQLFLSKSWLQAHCIQQSIPKYAYPSFSINEPMCHWQTFSYVIYDGGEHCCLLDDITSAHIYYFLFLKSEQQANSVIKASAIIRSDRQSCSCQNSSGIKEGLMTLQIG